MLSGIGADFGIKGGLEPRYPAAEPYNHLGGNMIGQNAQPITGDLQRQMPVAQMPGDAQQIRRISRLNIEDRLGSGADAQKAAAFQFQTIAFDKVVGPREIEQKILARIGFEPDAPAMPIEIGERNRVDRGLFRPIAPSVDRDRSPHHEFTMRR
jgi:hypothetical protein